MTELTASFFESARLGNLDALRTMLEENPGLMDARDDTQTTPLMAAAESGHMRVVRFLVESGADLQARDMSGRNVLYAAAQTSHGVIAEYLVRQGLDPDELLPVGLSPNGIAEAVGFNAVAELMRDTRAAFNAAAQKEQEETRLRLAREIGAEVMAGAMQGMPAPATAKFSRKP